MPTDIPSEMDLNERHKQLEQRRDKHRHFGGFEPLFKRRKLNKEENKEQESNNDWNKLIKDLNEFKSDNNNDKPKRRPPPKKRSIPVLIKVKKSRSKRVSS